jgi:hypothetical protein
MGGTETTTKGKTMSEYNWTITVDEIDDGSAVGTVGPHDADMTHDEIKNHPDRKHFMLYDDDGIHYYSGFYVGDDSDNLFPPLEGFGLPHAGCTDLRYRGEDGKYRGL